jgi:enoyl-CoA hydratase/carnithine racemase
MAEFESVSVKESRGILTLRLNRPEKLNALLMETLDEIDAALERAASRKSVRAVIVTGEGRAFCSGMDLSCLKIFQKASGPEMRRMLRKINATFNAFELLEKPVVAALNGITVGAGLEIALACDVRIAAEGAKMGLVETRVGVLPDGGGCVRLARHVGIGRAKEMILTGNLISAEEGHRIGLVNRVVPSKQLERAARKFAEETMQGGPLGIGLAKRVISRAHSLDIETGIEVEALATSPLYSSRDAKEAADALQARRKPRFQGR